MLAAILLASENAVKTSAEAIQALGGAHYLKEFPVERFLRDAKLYDIVCAKTNEIRRFLIGRQNCSAYEFEAEVLSCTFRLRSRANRMTHLGSTIDTSSENFQRNVSVNRALVEQLRACRENVARRAGADPCAPHRPRQIAAARAR